MAGRADTVRALPDAVQAVRPVEQDGTWARIEARFQADAAAAGELDWNAHADSTVVRAHQHAAGARKEGSTLVTQRDGGLGKSRGGWTTKLHTIGEGRGRNLTSHLTPGQDADTTQLVRLLDDVAVARPAGTGRPRKRLDSLAADKAYSSKANRAALRRRRIPHDIPEKDDQKANRTRKGRRGGRPPTFRPARYKQRNHIERLMNRTQAVPRRGDPLRQAGLPLPSHRADRRHLHLAPRQTRPTPAMIQVTRGPWQEVRCRYAARRRRVTRPDSLGDHPGVTVPPRPRIGPGPPR